jgi:hypothetical protein
MGTQEPGEGPGDAAPARPSDRGPERPAVRRRRVPVLLVVVPVLVLFAVVLSWAIREGQEMGLLGQGVPVTGEVAVGAAWSPSAG